MKTRLGVWSLTAAAALAGWTMGMAAQSKPSHAGKPSRTTRSMPAGLSPEVVIAGSPDAIIHLGRTGLEKLGSLKLTACDGKERDLTIQSGGEGSTVTLPAATIAAPCVLHLASYALGVADPKSALLKVPPYQRADYLPWSGMFDMLLDDVQPPQGFNGSLIMMIEEGTASPRFVFGKARKALLIPAVVTRIPANGGGFHTYLALPGMKSEDVKWGPNDTEGFWIGVLSPDGSTVAERLFLADMVTEPSGPLDKL